MNTPPFTRADFENANKEWGCNCGPSALAFALQVTLDAARRAIAEFDARRYTSPKMMHAALLTLNAKYRAVLHPTDLWMFFSDPALVRIQWHGPWTAPGANQRWAYRYTHWITTWRTPADVVNQVDYVFDCNGGPREFASWKSEIVPLLTQGIKRADGRWSPTHIWRIAA